MNQLYYGDNLDVLRRHIADSSVDLVYLDPPFNSNRSYNVLFQSRSGDAAQAQIEAFDDTWTWSQETEEEFDNLLQGEVPPRVADTIQGVRRLLGDNDVLAYLVMMTPRLVELHRVLKTSGSLVLHCDPTVSHYLKVILDQVFNPRNFRNEIIWKRTAAKGDARRKFGAIHDVLLCYGKTEASFFEPARRPPDEEYRARFRHDDSDSRGPYQSAPLDSPNPRPNLTYEYKGHQPPAKGWRVSREVMEELDREGRLIFPSKPGGRIREKNYLNEQEWPNIGDVWNDIAPLQATSAERLGYPTQKPLALLERLTASLCPEGGVVLDPFCGCGTTVAAAQALGRRWIGIDITFLSIDLIEKRLLDTYGEEIRASYETHGIPRDFEGARALFELSPFEFERWAVSLVNGTPNEKQVGDKGMDGVIRFPLDKKNVGRILVSVKGGRQLNPAMVRDLVGTVNSQGAEMGVLITMTNPTRGMVDAANHSGLWEWPINGTKFPKVQIVSVGELLRGVRPKLPPTFLPYMKARRVKFDDQQLAFGVEDAPVLPAAPAAETSSPWGPPPEGWSDSSA